MPTPYLFFDGRCEEAIDFYKKALGAEVKMMMRFKDSPEPPPPGRVAPGSDNKIMHSCLSINGEDVMASDGCAQGKPKFEGFSLSINAKDEAEADRAIRYSEGCSAANAANAATIAASAIRIFRTIEPPVCNATDASRQRPLKPPR